MKNRLEEVRKIEAALLLRMRAALVGVVQDIVVDLDDSLRVVAGTSLCEMEGRPHFEEACLGVGMEEADSRNS